MRTRDRLSPFCRRWRHRRRSWGSGRRLWLRLFRAHRRFLCKDASQHGEEVVYCRFLLAIISKDLHLALFDARVEPCCTHIPVLLPLSQIRVVYPSITADMLSGSDQHVLRRCYVYDGRLSGVCVGHPYRNWEAVCRAAKGDGEGA